MFFEKSTKNLSITKEIAYLHIRQEDRYREGVYYEHVWREKILGEKLVVLFRDFFESADTATGVFFHSREDEFDKANVNDYYSH